MNSNGGDRCFAEGFVLDGLVNLTEEIADQFFQSPQRIKFSLAAVSSKYLILIARSGSLYIYRRDPLQFLILIPSCRRVGSIERIVISPDSSYVVLANSKAELFVQNISGIDGHLADLLAYNKNLPEIKFIGTAKASITCFYWSTDEKQLFYGDRNGHVCLVSLGQFNLAIHPILVLDSEIVQIDGFDLLLVVSTRTKCILCNSDREEFKQIGNRPRDGHFGACFMNKSIDEFLRGQVICARPGARFWQVDYGGTVKQTIQFKDALAKRPTIPFNIHSSPGMTDSSSQLAAAADQTKKHSSSSTLSFGQLTELTLDGEHHFLVTHTKTGIYVFDPLNTKLILWTDYFTNIHDVFVVDNSIYCVTDGGGGGEGIAVSCCVLRPKGGLFESLLKAGNFALTKRFILDNRSFLKQKSSSVRETLRGQMELLKEALIREREYECLEIISEIAFREEVVAQQPVAILAQKRDTNADKTARTMIASALRSTFHLFTQMKAGQPQSELIRANGGAGLGSGEPMSLKLELFREITTSFTSSGGGGDSDAIVVVDKKKFFTNRKFRKLSELLKSNEGEEDEAMREGKLLKNLFLIYKSSRIGNVNMVDRYAPMLDQLSLQQVLALMRKLEAVMQENEYSEAEARRNSSLILFDYLKPDVINEADVDNEALEELIDRYVLVNGDRVRHEAGSKDHVPSKYCQTCSFPVTLAAECLYYDFGRTLFEFLYAREDVQNYQRLMRNIPHLLHIFAKYYRESSDRESYLQLLFVLRKFSIGNCLGPRDWSYLFDLMNELMTNSIIRCFNCGKWSSVAATAAGEAPQLPAEYSWNYMLTQAARFMNGPTLLKEVLKHANAIRSGEISKEFFLKCMQTA